MKLKRRTADPAMNRTETTPGTEAVTKAETTSKADTPKKKKNLLSIVCITLIVVFTLVLVADVVNRFTLQTGMSGQLGGVTMDSDTLAAGDMTAGGMSMGDVTAGDTAEFSTDSMPSGDMVGDFSGDEMPSGDMAAGGMTMGGMTGGDMTMGDAAGDMTLPAEGDTALTDLQTSGSTSVLLSLRTALRQYWIAVLAVCLVGDGVCSFLLLRQRRKRKLAQALLAAESGELVEEEDYVPRKKPIWMVPVALILVVALVFGLIPRLNFGTSSSITVTWQTLSGTVETGTIDTVLSGTGTLTEESAVSITIPDTVTVSTYYVENGDTVAQGDLIATVSLTSVITAIVELQEVLDQIDEAMAEAAEEGVATTLTATTGGRIKTIYAQEGVSVADTVVEYGCLMVISLDGYMAVEIDAADGMTVGDTVTVTLSDGTGETGRIAQLLNGVATVIVTDEGTAVDDTVTITDDDGSELGSGNLYIHSELRVLSYYGVVSELAVEVDDTVEAGDSLLTLSDVGNSSTYTSLLSQRQELEEQMEVLYALYRDSNLYATCDGVVSGISDDATITKLTSATDTTATVTNTAAGSTTGFVLNLLTATTSAGAGTETSEAGEGSGMDEGGEGDTVQPGDTMQPDEGDTDSGDTQSGETGLAALIPALAGIGVEQTDSDVSLQSAVSYDTEIIRFVLVDDSELDAATPGTYTVTFLIIANREALAEALGEEISGTGKYTVLEEEVTVTVVTAEDALRWQMENPTLLFLAAENSDSSDTGDGDDSAIIPPGDGNTEDSIGDSTDLNDGDVVLPGGDSSEDSDNMDYDSVDYDSVDYDSMDVDTVDTDAMETGSMDTGNTEVTTDTAITADNSAAAMQSSDATAVADSTSSISYSISQQTLLSITPQDTMTISISVDELDILSLSLGQEAEITLDALTSRSFTGTVTAIATSGTNSGGNTKFAVEITMERTEQMLSGMNAAVKITLDTTEDVLTIPEAALVEEGSTVYVYTSYNEKTDTLGDPVVVQTGVSDGTTVEILSGLSLGDTFYYSYADTLTYTFATSGLGSLLG